MRILKKLFLLILVLNFLTLDTFALTNKKIIDLCKKERKKKACIDRLKSYKLKLNQGLPIEIPVIPFKK